MCALKMACISGTTGNETAQKFLDSLQNDLKNLSIETKKKFPQIKESCEEGIVKLRNASANPQTPIFLYSESDSLSSCSGL
ncbi:hypothetical protein L9F63_022625 [Diploptera punctata]|uniref:Mon2/Sec7/BIG1-like dimerisation and cyclophilin-binding domain-containing protein n=1 Tax=Diploptera punctata TaxID=6984 RepID=A0AAD7ZLL5_DIPPU|nr:hypothetical protein L9F63_022625 [Diploptera punctata]